MIDTIYRIYTYTLKMCAYVRTCVRARMCECVRVRADTLSLLRILAEVVPSRIPDPRYLSSSSSSSSCSLPASLAISPTRHTHLRTYPLRIAVAMLCRNVSNE